MFGLTYELWNEIVHDVSTAHSPLFEAMHDAVDGIDISRDLVLELKKNGMIDIGEEPWSFFLQIDPIDDAIEGFRISLISAENIDLFESSIAKSAANHGISLEEIEGFEAEHGLEIYSEIIKTIEELYNITAEIDDGEVLFELTVFDSQDIDNCKERDLLWK